MQLSVTSVSREDAVFVQPPARLPHVWHRLVLRAVT